MPTVDQDLYSSLIMEWRPHRDRGALVEELSMRRGPSLRMHGPVARRAR